MSDIHPTAILDDGASIGDNVAIGPYTIVGGDVVLDDGVILESHVVVSGQTTVGANTRIFPFASIGSQGLKNLPPSQSVAERKELLAGFRQDEMHPKLGLQVRVFEMSRAARR